ncbi:MAG TPA: GGDEF domain-containing protein, partial [Blastocatellia bacterium]|nr:GGDEF domain-containing protein [Blastocatellia bacterium]
NINDTLGHSIGDKVLSVAAKRFSRVVNAEDTVARIGGGEF